jgi:UPF0755 protein
MKKILATKRFYLWPVAACLIGIGGLAYYYFCTGFSNCQETSYLYVDADDTADSVFAKLQPVAKSQGMAALRTLLRHQGYDKSVRPGRYAVDPGDGVITMFRRLKNGQQSPMMITIPECRTMPRLAAILARTLMADSAAIAQALADSVLTAQLGYDSLTLPSMFVPETYEVYWNVSPEQLLHRLAREHDRFWNYERQQRAGALGLTPNEVCTLASIIDEETANNAEKPMVARMYLNRLQKNMPLQADPTVKFALQRFELRRIYHDMLRVQSPYNTYVNTGLPPGPIKIASVRGIDAVLSPAQHSYLYMCAKEDFSGTHNFAATYQEHLRNAARYAQALNERGVK